MIEFLLHQESGEFEVGRVPCIGEHIASGYYDGECYGVVDVIQLLNPKPGTVVAIVRVNGKLRKGF